MEDAAAGLQPYASAIAGSALALRWEDSAEARSWCDGRVIWLARTRAEQAWLDVSLQALLVRGGALHADAMRVLRMQPAAARTYLALELARAIATHEPILPRRLLAHAAVLELKQLPVSANSADSLARAKREPRRATPPAWGVLRPSRVVSGAAAQLSVTDAQQNASAWAERQQAERELEDSSILEAFRNPIEGSVSMLGRLLDSLLERRAEGGTRPDGGGQAGADAAREGVTSSAAQPLAGDPKSPAMEAALEHSVSRRYPEWDESRQRYRPQYVSVADVEPDPENPRATPLPPPAAARRLHKTLSRLCLGFQPRRHQSSGEDIDVDALVRLWSDLRGGGTGDARVYVANLRARRELAAMILLDVSGSTAERAADGVTVFDRQLGFALSLAAALHDAGDRIGLYCFHSWGSKLVRMPRIVSLGAGVDARARQRARCIAPVGYSRLGAAIRHGTAVLHEDRSAPRQLLVVISDALAYDKGYESEYAYADTRRALAEARGANVACVCLSVGASCESGVLERAFGGSRYLRLPEIHGGERALRELFERALADASRRAG